MKLAVAAGLAVSLGSTLVFAQTLGQVAAKEKERREANAEKGVSARTFTSSGGNIAEKARDGEPPSPAEADESDVPSGSLLEAEREKAAILEPRMAEIAHTADELDVLYERYLHQCYGRQTLTTTPGTITGADPASSYRVLSGHRWLIVLENPSALVAVEPGPGRKTVSTAQTPACQKLLSDLIASATDVKTSMEELLEDARKKGILPGMVRELREKYNLLWSRYKL